METVWTTTDYIYTGIYFLIGILGVLAHYFKRRIHKQTFKGIKDYFASHIGDTISTLIAYIVSFAIMLQTQDLSILTVFIAGYSADSLFAKIDADEQKPAVVEPEPTPEPPAEVPKKRGRKKK